MTANWIRPFFVAAGLYDFVLGAAFLLFFKPLYRFLEIPPPNHDGYVQWGAAVVAIFGIAFWLVATAPQRNRDIIRLGVLFKIAYAAIVLEHFFFGSIPVVWTIFAWIDLAFCAGFVVALRALSLSERAAEA